VYIESMNTDHLLDVLDEVDAEIMDWVYEIIEINFGSELVQDSTKLREIIKQALETVQREAKEELRNEIEHDQRKLLDGFSHPKNCKMCEAPTRHHN